MCPEHQGHQITPPSTARWSANTRRAVARRRDRDGGFLCCKPGQADPWESVYCGSAASHACHPLEELTRNLTPDKTLGPIERMLVGVSTSERYPALRGCNSSPFKSGRPMSNVPRGSGQSILCPFCIGAGDGSQGAPMDADDVPRSLGGVQWDRVPTKLEGPLWSKR